MPTAAEISIILHICILCFKSCVRDGETHTIFELT